MNASPISYFDSLQSLLKDWGNTFWKGYGKIESLPEAIAAPETIEPRLRAMQEGVAALPESLHPPAEQLLGHLKEVFPYQGKHIDFTSFSIKLKDALKTVFATPEATPELHGKGLQDALTFIENHKASAETALKDTFVKVYEHFAEGRATEGDAILHGDAKKMIDRTVFLQMRDNASKLWNSLHNNEHSTEVPPHIRTLSRTMLEAHRAGGASVSPAIHAPTEPIPTEPAPTPAPTEPAATAAPVTPAAAPSPAETLESMANAAQEQQKRLHASFVTHEAALLEKEGMLGYAKRLMTHRWTGKDPLPPTGEHAGATLEQFGHTALEGKLEKGLAIASGVVSVGAIVQGGSLMAQGLTEYTDLETGEKKAHDVTRLLIGAGEIGVGAAGLLFTATGRMKFWKPLQAVAGRVA